MTFSKYAAIVTGSVAASMLAAFPLLNASAETRAFQAALLGGLLAALNALFAYALVVWSHGRSNLAFMRAVLGGMLGRMAFLLGAVVISIVGFGLPPLPLVISLLGHFVVFLGLELAAVQGQPARAGVAR